MADEVENGPIRERAGRPYDRIGFPAGVEFSLRARHRWHTQDSPERDPFTSKKLSYVSARPRKSSGTLSRSPHGATGKDPLEERLVEWPAWSPSQPKSTAFFVASLPSRKALAAAPHRVMQQSFTPLLNP